MKDNIDQVSLQIIDQAWGQIDNTVCIQVMRMVDNQIWGQVSWRFREHIKRKLEKEIKDEIENCV